MSDELTIKCRVGISDQCYDGKLSKPIYPDGPQDDRTYDFYDGSVVCDSCYIKLGQPLFKSVEELNQRLGIYR